MSYSKRFGLFILAGLAFAIVLFLPEANAQSSSVPGDVIWHTFYGGNNIDKAFDAVVDGAGNIYITGMSVNSWNIPDIPINPHTAGLYNIFVAKLDCDGNLIWHTFMGAAGKYDLCSGIAMDRFGNLYVTGWSSATWGNPITAYSGSREVFVAKLDNDGHLKWNTFMGSSHTDKSFGGIAVDYDGNVYVAGESYLTWGNPIYPKLSGMYEGFAAKLDTNGNLKWNTFMGTTNIDYGGRGIVVDASGNVYVTGQSNFYGTDGTWGQPVSNNPDRPTAPILSHNCDGCWRASVAKLNNDGYLQWYTFLEYEGNDITVDNMGKVYVTGNGHSNAFVAKFDCSTGSHEWTSYQGDASLNDWGYGIIADGDGHIYATGVAASNGWPFVWSLEDTGALDWYTLLGVEVGGRQAGRGIGLDDKGYLYVAGKSQLPWGDPLHDHNSVANPSDGGEDVLVAKLFASRQIDTTPPIIDIPDDITVNNDPGESTAIVTFTPTATDNVDGDVPVTCEPESGTAFSIGSTEVNCAATDAAGNEATGSFFVIVEDNEPPVITVPEDITAYTGAENCSANVEFTVTATDNSESAVTVQCAPESGSPFDKGVTTVFCTATDESGNSATAEFNVTVIDNVAPVIICPGDIMVGPDPGRDTAIVDFAAYATDNCDADVAISYTMPPGSAFPMGKTSVVCTAVDDYGNQSSCEFTITVKDVEPPVMIIANDSLVMWPPDHKYRTFSLDDFGITVTDNCSTELTVKITKVSSDELEDERGNGDGKTKDDMVIGQNGESVSLRAERQGKGNGRIYTVYFEATDEAGNTAEAFCRIGVPHDKKDTPVDDGPVYWVVPGGMD